MRALLISVGSRGDAEPFCSLTQQLLAAGHRVDIFLQPEHETLIPNGADFHALPFNSQDFYKFVGAPKYGTDHPNPRVKFVGIVTDIISSLVLPTAADVSNVISARNSDADPVDVLVCSSLARPLAIAVSEKHKLPLSIVHLQPLAPTRLFPHYSNTKECVKAIMGESDRDDETAESNLNSYWELEQFQYEFLKDSLDALYKELGLDDKLQTFAELKAILSGQHELVHIANCFSLVIVPPDDNDKQAGTNNLHNIGPLADTFVPSDFVPSSDLVQFLKTCEIPPICIGYGSMPFERVEEVMLAVKELKEKVILVGGVKLPQVSDEDSGNFFHIDSVPYPWLLPQCSMMLSHGGAGVLNATLRAGIPPVISPLMGDQFTWAALVTAKSIGSRTEAMLPALTKDDILQGIRDARKNLEGAKAVGEEIRSGPEGVHEMLKLLEVIPNISA